MTIAARIIPLGRWPDSADRNRSYWLARPHSERIEACRRLRRKYWRLFHLMMNEGPPGGSGQDDFDRIVSSLNQHGATLNCWRQQFDCESWG